MGENKQEQVLNDLASFYESTADFGADYGSELNAAKNSIVVSPKKITPPTSDSEEAPIQRNVFIGAQDTSRRRRARPGATTNRRRVSGRGKNSQEQGALLDTSMSGGGRSQSHERDRRPPHPSQSGDGTGDLVPSTSHVPPRTKSRSGDTLGDSVHSSSTSPSNETSSHHRRERESEGSTHTHNRRDGETTPHNRRKSETSSHNRRGEIVEGSSHRRPALGRSKSDNGLDEMVMDGPNKRSGRRPDPPNNSGHLGDAARRGSAGGELQKNVAPLNDRSRNLEANNGKNDSSLMSAAGEESGKYTKEALKDETMSSEDNKLKSATQGGDLDKLNKVGEGRSSRRAREGGEAKGGASKGDTELINKTKSEVEEHKPTGRSRRDRQQRSRSPKGGSSSRRENESRRDGEQRSRSPKGESSAKRENESRRDGEQRSSSPKGESSSRRENETRRDGESRSTTEGGESSGSREKRDFTRVRADGESRREGESAGSRGDGDSSRSRERREFTRARGDGESRREGESTGSRGDGESRRVRKGTSKWSGVRGGMEFINKTKAAVPNSGRSRSWDRRKKRPQNDEAEKSPRRTSAGSSSTQPMVAGQPKLTRSNSDSSLSVKKPSSHPELDDMKGKTGEPLKFANEKKLASDMFKSLMSKEKESKETAESNLPSNSTNEVKSKEAEPPTEDTSDKDPASTSTIFNNLLSKTKATKERNTVAQSTTDVQEEDGKKKKKSSKWKGLKGGMDFTNRLISKTSVKSKKDKDEKLDTDDCEQAGKSSSEPKKKGNKWNFASKLGGGKKKEKYEERMDYGLVMSKASFSGDVVEGPAVFKVPETLEEGDEDASETDDSEKGESNQEVMQSEHYQSDAFAAIMGGFGPDQNQLDAFAKMGGDESHVDQSQPNAFVIIGDGACTELEENVQADAFALLGGEVASAAPPRRQQFSKVVEPSMRFDFDRKTETITSRTAPDIFEENEKADELEEDYLKIAESRDVPETILEEDEEDENDVEPKGSTAAQESPTIEDLIETPPAGVPAKSASIEVIKSMPNKNSAAKLCAAMPELETLVASSAETEISADVGNITPIKQRATSEIPSTSEADLATPGSDESRKKKGRKRRSKWTGLKHGMEFTNKLYAITDQKKNGEGADSENGGTFKKTSNQRSPAKLKKKEDPPAETFVKCGEESGDNSQCDEGDALQGSADHETSERSDHEEAEPGESDEPGVFSIMATVGKDDAASSVAHNRRHVMSKLAKPSMRFDFDKKTENFVSRTAPDIAEEDNESESDSGDDGDVEMNAEMHDANESETSDDEDVDHISFLSPLKCMQLQIGAGFTRSTVGDDLAISIHSLSEERMNQQSDGMKVHHMDSWGVKFDEAHYLAQSEKKKKPASKASNHVLVEEVVKKEVGKSGSSDSRPKSDREPSPEREHGEDANKEKSEQNLMEPDFAHDADDDQDSWGSASHVDLDDGNESLRSSCPSIAIAPADSNLQTPPDMQAEHERLVRELEESQVRTTLARESVRSLQQEIQRQRHHYGEVERRKQLSLKRLEMNNVCLKRG